MGDDTLPDAHRHLEEPRGFNRLVERDLLLIHLKAALHQDLGDVGRGYRPKEPPTLATFRPDLDHRLLQRGGKFLHGVALPLEALGRRLLLVLQGAHVALCGRDRQPAWEEVVARVPFLDVPHRPSRTQPVDILQENDLHRHHDGALATVRQRRRKSSAASASPSKNNTNPVGPLLNNRITITRYHLENRYFSIKIHPASMPRLSSAKKIRKTRFVPRPSSGASRRAPWA